MLLLRSNAAAQKRDMGSSALSADTSSIVLPTLLDAFPSLETAFANPALFSAVGQSDACSGMR